MRNKSLTIVTFLAAALAAAAAFYISNASNFEQSSFRVVALMRSQALKNHVPLVALKTAVASSELQQKFQSQIQLSDVSGDDSLFEVSLENPNRLKALSETRLLQQELEKTLVGLVTKEVKQTRDLVDKVERPKTKPEPMEPEIPDLEPALDPTTASKALRLREEITQLEAFQRGSPIPEWLKARLESKLHEKYQRTLVSQQSELANLELTFTPSSQVVLKQKQAIGETKAKLIQSQRHESKFLLQAYKQELNKLENEATSKVESNLEALRRPVDQPIEESQQDQPWLDIHSEDLAEKESSLRSLAQVQLVSEPAVTELKEFRKPLTIGLWVLSGMCLLLGLSFAAADPKEEVTRPEPARTPTPAIPEMAHPASFRKPVSAKPDRFLLKVLDAIKEEVGPEARRILVLGSAEADNHPAVAARLAKTISNTKQRVRLVDFEFQNKTLSKQLNNAETVGVSDLIVMDAPVHEFFASVAGTEIDFAPAGRQKFVPEALNPKCLERLLHPEPGQTLVVNANFKAPLHLVISYLDAVICVTAAGQRWNQEEQEVLMAIKEAELPIWGILQGDHEIYPFT